jgi:Leucine-rich repeat (LRR) protein
MALQAQVAIDATNFPDENFRGAVAAFDTDGDGTLSQTEIKNVTSISVDNMSIAQLDGIEFFTAITSLKCDNNNLTSLDLSSNTKLKTLSCHNNSLTSLNVVGCTALEKMYCQTNQLVSLTVASTALTDRVLKISFFVLRITTHFQD